MPTEAFSQHIIIILKWMNKVYVYGHQVCTRYRKGGKFQEHMTEHDTTGREGIAVIDKVIH